MKERFFQYRGFVISVLVHLGLFLFFASIKIIPTIMTEEGVQVEWVNLEGEDSDKLEKRQVVEQDEVALNNDKPLDNYKLSRNDQRVFEETKARNNGDFKNSDKDGQGDSKAKSIASPAIEEPKPETKPKKKFSLADLLPATVQTPAQRKPATVASDGTGQAGSATNDYLKDIKAGSKTLLNTREFVYYSYYNRIRTKLRQQWEPQIKGKITKILQQGRSISTISDKITRLVITLDKGGELVKIQVRSQSGYHELDEAAIDAFRAAAPFPNPPSGIQDRLGEIKINWDFVLES